jgi:putative heme iron utilization protein
MNKSKFVICIDNSEYPASLEKRKIYESVADSEADKHGQIRIIDESGDDYLFPAECFVEVNLSDDIREAVVRAA